MTASGLINSLLSLIWKEDPHLVPALVTFILLFSPPPLPRYLQARFIPYWSEIIVSGLSSSRGDSTRGRVAFSFSLEGLQSVWVFAYLFHYQKQRVPSRFHLSLLFDLRVFSHESAQKNYHSFANPISTKTFLPLMRSVIFLVFLIFPASIISISDPLDQTISDWDSNPYDNLYMDQSIFDNDSRSTLTTDAITDFDPTGIQNAGKCESEWSHVVKTTQPSYLKISPRPSLFKVQSPTDVLCKFLRESSGIILIRVQFVTGHTKSPILDAFCTRS